MPDVVEAEALGSSLSSGDDLLGLYVDVVPKS